MHETFLIVQTYIRMIWRYHWLALLVGVAICMAGWMAVLAMPNQFEASTKVFLDTQSVLRPLLRGLALDTNRREQTAELVRKSLLSRPNLETVARSADLDLTVNSPEAFDGLLTRLSKKIQISGTTRDNIYVIKYTDTEAERTAHVVEKLLNIFVERSLGESRKDSTTSSKFLEEQITEYEIRLEKAESRLKEFRQQNVGLMPTDKGDYFARLQTVSSELSGASLQLQEARNRRDELRRQIEGVGALFEPIVTAREMLPHALDERIRGLETVLDEYLLRYTEEHPDVIATRKVLEEVKARRAADQQQHPTKGERPSQQLDSPIYQELKGALASAEADVAGLGVRVSEYRRRQTELKRLINTVPEVEAELAKLNRDYEVNKTNFEELLRRRESLSIADEASQTTDDFQFNVIEPPRVPLVPKGPPRVKFGAGVLVIGLGAGVALAWLIAMLRPMIYTKQGFEEFTDLPILGTVSRVWTPREQHRRRLGHACFASVVLVLFGMFAGFIYLQGLDVDFGSKFSLPQIGLLSQLTGGN